MTRVLDHFRATSQISQTTLRSVLGQSLLDDLLSEREQINAKLQQIIDEQTEPWGVKVSTVEVKDVELPQGMQPEAAATLFNNVCEEIHLLLRIHKPGRWRGGR